MAPLSERSTGGGGGGAGGWVPTVSGDTPMTLEEERTVPELLPPSVLLPRSDKDDSSVLGRKIRLISKDNHLKLWRSPLND